MSYQRWFTPIGLGILLSLLLVGLSGVAEGVALTTELSVYAANAPVYTASTTTTTSPQHPAPAANAVTAMVTTAAITATSPATITALATVSTTLTTTDTALAQQLDKMLADMAATPAGFSGSVLVARNGQPIFNKGYGMASYELSVPNSPEGKYRIASLTKGFVALAIMQLQQQKLLNVKDSICKYLDPCPESWRPITIHDLLSHQSGIPDYANFLTSSDWRSRVLPERLIALVRDTKLPFAPGTQFEYSNTNYVILGVIVTKQAEQPFSQYLREHILDPIGMADSGMDDAPTVLKNRVSGYETAKLPAAYLDMSTMSTAGGMYSTAEDLLRWDQALYGDKLVATDLLEQMFMPQSPPVSGMESTNGHSGYGWFVDDAHGRRRIGNGGDMVGFRSVIDRFPDDKVTVILLSNRSDVDPFATADLIEERLFPSK